MYFFAAAVAIPLSSPLPPHYSRIMGLINNNNSNTNKVFTYRSKQFDGQVVYYEECMQ